MSEVSAASELKPNQTQKPNPSDPDIEIGTIKEHLPRDVEGLSTNDEPKTERVKTRGAEEEKPKPSKIKELWGKLGLDIGTVLMMFKGSIPPTIGIAFYQATSVAETFATLGYLVPIVAVLSIAIMPRAKFLQNLFLNTLGICIAASVALLGIWSGVQARKHTTAVGSRALYNSSQSAVCAIWLFVNIWFVNVLRAKMPALQFPVMMYSIFTNVAFTFGPLLPTIIAGESLIKLLLKAFLTAFAISTGVNLFIIPISSRTVIFKEQAQYIQLIRGTLKAQSAYLQSLESSDMFAPEELTKKNDETDEGGKKKKTEKGKAHPASNPQAEVLKASLAGIRALHGKLHGDMTFAKREMAWGKLNAKDLDEIFKLFQSILIPLIGMSTIMDIFERIAERRGWISVANSKFDQAEAWEQCEKAQKDEEKRTWNEIMKTLHEPFEVVTRAMDEGMEHVGLVLELLPKPKTKKGEEDIEAKGGNPKPGDRDFAEYLNKKVLDFYSKRGKVVKAWARQKDLMKGEYDESGAPAESYSSNPDEAKHRRDQQQLYIILFLEHLLYSTGVAVANFVKFADSKIEDGTMKKNRLIVPGQRRIRKWIMSIGQEDTTVGSESPDSLEAGTNTVYLGSAFSPKRDPEHLPPKTAWQHFGNGIRTIPHFLGSSESAFGLRVTCATLTIGIVAFLKNTQSFFIEQRLVWAMIIIAIGMSMTSGQSIFGFLARIAGTSISMVSSIAIWYIVDQKIPGIIVFLWLYIFLLMYFFLKQPRFIAVWIISIVTTVLIIGYELQVRKIGIKAASATGQPYYRIFELAPYRLACVAGGSFVAFIWTIFPYPLSDRSWIRRDLGTTLYLLANYYSVVHSTIRLRMHVAEGDMDSKSSPGKRLEKARQKVFGKLMLLVPQLSLHASWEKYEPSIGGVFPRETYDAITFRATNIMNYLSLMSYATQSWSEDHSSLYPNSKPAARRQWLTDLATLVDSIGPTSHGITSVLSLLSASVLQGSALPPFIQLPPAYNLTRRLEALDQGILDARHIEEPGYSAYAVMQVCSSLLTDDLKRLVEHVKDLVGETDFSFKFDGSESSFQSTTSEESNNEKGKAD